MVKKNYYAIIPARVRYDKDLIAHAKLMYGELTALSNQSGFCWASNQYFSDLYETSERSIQRWIKALEQKKYIKVEVKGVNRKIWIMEFVETDEDGNPMERRKKTRLPRESKNKIAIRLQHKFLLVLYLFFLQIPGVWVYF